MAVKKFPNGAHFPLSLCIPYIYPSIQRHGQGKHGQSDPELLRHVFQKVLNWVGPWIPNIFPDGFNRGTYILVFLKGF